MRLYKCILSLLILSLFLSACQFPGAAPANWQDVKSASWWKDATFYEIFVRSFADSNGDGIGDFKGLTQKLDYLNDGKNDPKTSLGVTALWLMPIFPSPSYHGYDVTDYYTVNPQYGTMEDFKTLISEAHKRGIKIIIDFVINHTSSQNPWFKASAAKDPKYADWYIWSDQDPGYKGPWGEDVWYKEGDRYYYAVFDKAMPDLNYKNPAVTQEIDKIADFWLKDVGIDGFRLDGAKHLIEEGQQQENTQATKDYWKTFSAHIKQTKSDAFAIGEVWSPVDQAAPYVNNGDLDMVFNFPLADDILSGATFKDARRISSSLVQSSKSFKDDNYGTFLSNHDQTRVMTKVGSDLNRAKAAAAVLLTSPGTPYLYYGEEIGQSGDKPDPQIRMPMQWSAEANAGFSTGTPWQAPSADYTQKNVAAQGKDPASLLNLYRQLIQLRSNHYALRTGKYVQATSNSNMVFASLRVAEKESVLVLVNLSKDTVKDIKIKWSDSPLKGTYQPTLLYGEGKVASLTVTGSGAVSDYSPIGEIPGYGILVVQYRP